MIMQSLGSDIEELYDAVGLRAVYREDGGVGPWLGALIGNCESKVLSLVFIPAWLTKYNSGRDREAKERK
jgi:hypothetical protein